MRLDSGNYWARTIYSGLCSLCGDLFFTTGPTVSFCGRKCGTKVRPRGPDNWNWKGGTKKLRGGYIGAHAPDHPNADCGYVREHRLVMEKHLGRYLKPHESVHHVNGRRDDNRLENLQLWTKPQPAGQRVEDLVAWVVSEYPDEVRNYLAIGASSDFAVCERL